MGYTLQQLQQMGAKPVATSTPASTPKKKYTLEELKALGAKEPVSVAPVELKRDTILPQFKPVANEPVKNLARTFGNIPSSAERLTKATIAPINPFDTKSKMNIGANLSKIGTTAYDIVKEQGPIEAIKNIYVKGPLELVKNASKGVLGFGGKTAENVATSVEQRGIGGALAEGAGKVAETLIKDPLLLPSIMYAPSKIKATGVTTDSISATSKFATKPITKLKDAVVNNTIKSPARTEKYITKRANTFEELMNATVKPKQVLEKSKAKGYDVTRTLASNDKYIPQIIEGKIVPDEAIMSIQNDIKPMAQMVREVIDTDGRMGNLNEWKAKALAGIEDLKKEGDVYNKVKSNIEKDFAVYMEQFPSGIAPLGFLDDVKKAKYEAINWNKPNKMTADRAIARASRESIEDSIDDISIKQMNRELGALYDAQEALEALQGRAVKGGRLGKYFARGFGIAVGSSGGPIGAILGGLTADKIADIMQSTYFKQPITQRMIGEIKTTRPDIFKKAMELVEQRKADLKTRRQLPQGSTRMNAPKDNSGLDLQKMQALKEYYKELDRENILKLPAGTSNQNRANINLPASPRQIPEEVISEGAIKAPSTGTNIVPQTNNLLIEQNPVPLPQSFQKKNLQTTNPINADAKNPITKTVPRNKPNTQGGFISTGFRPADLSTKILKKLEGKTSVNKQFISDLTNSGDIKQVEKDLIREVLGRFDDGKIDVNDFGKAVEAELLPLKRQPQTRNNPEATNFGAKYESISLPYEVKGNVKSYSENIYESPIKTSAGKIHFGDNRNYFGHTRIEDMADNKTRRLIEVQSDLFQKGNLEKEVGTGYDFERLNELENAKKAGKSYSKSDLESLRAIKKEFDDNPSKNPMKLYQYNNPTAHFRMLREEVKKASQDGKEKLLVPTGETAMKIEGLGTQGGGGMDFAVDGFPIEISDLKAGKEIYSEASDQDWIITEVLSNGKFRAVSKDIAEGEAPEALTSLGRAQGEMFDISGEIDKENPIYKFYEKEINRYVKNKYNATPVTDDKGVTWYEIKIKPEYKDEPVEAFGKVKINPLFIGAGASAVVAGGAKVLEEKKKANLPKGK